LCLFAIELEINSVRINDDLGSKCGESKGWGVIEA